MALCQIVHLAVDTPMPCRHTIWVQRIKITPELSDRAWRHFYGRYPRVLTLTEGQRRHIAQVTERRLDGQERPA
jgi:hypothetical protein